MESDGPSRPVTQRTAERWGAPGTTGGDGTGTGRADPSLSRAQGAAGAGPRRREFCGVRGVSANKHLRWSMLLFNQATAVDADSLDHGARLQATKVSAMRMMINMKYLRRQAQNGAVKHLSRRQHLCVRYWACQSGLLLPGCKKK
jgi:hypothetical protein